MIPIKQHNEVVQKLMKEITSKQSQIKNLNKQKTKVPQQIPQLMPTQTQKALNNKISQLNKQYKDKINSLSQQIRNKSLQNKDLKERLTSKANMQAKQKEHISEMLKKSYDRKPSSAADYKISALITHYEAQLNKKVKYIQNLQKQIRQYQMNNTKDHQSEVQKNENLKIINENDQKEKGISFTQHKKQTSRLKMDMQKYKRLFEQRQKQYKDLSRRYSQLTNQYYKILNAYGIQPKQNTQQPHINRIKSQKRMIKNVTPVDKQIKKTALSNLLQEMIVSDSQTQDLCERRNILQKYQQQKQNKFNNEDQSQQQTQQHLSNAIADNFASSRIQEIMQFLKINQASQIIPKLTQIKTKIDEFQLADTIVRSLQVFFYNVGKGKIIKSELVRAIQDFEVIYNRNLQAVDILDELCIQIGAKRQKISEKLIELLKLKDQYYNQMKNIKYIQQLNKNNKVIEFIDFFQLDREELALPQQLLQIQQQLKAINKYIKEVRTILQVDNEKSPQMVLELALRYIEKASSLVSNYQKKNQKHKNTA